MMFTALLAGASTIGAVGLCVTFEGWVFYGMGWLQLLDVEVENSLFTVSVVVLMLTVMTVISIATLFLERRHR